MQAIATHGFAALSIDRVARRLRVTKGSFYWHFKDRDALLRAAVKRWERRAAAVLGELAAVPDPRMRLRALFAFLSSDLEFLREDAAITAAAPAWVAKRVDKSLADRLALLEATYGAIHSSRDRAAQCASLGLAAYLGTLRLLRTRASALRDDASLRAYIDHAAETLIPADA